MLLIANEFVNKYRVYFVNKYLAQDPRNVA